MSFDKPQMSSVETRDLRRIYTDLEKAREALMPKGGNIPDPLVDDCLVEAETLVVKMLRLDKPRHEAVD